MAPERRDRRILIQRKSVTYDAFNSPVDAWANVATVWAARENIRDAERTAAQQVGSERTDRFNILYSSDVANLDVTDRIIFDGRQYGIEAVKELGYRRELEITASAKAERI